MPLMIDQGRTVTPTDLLVAYAMFADSTHHPYVLMRKMDYELALMAFKEINGEAATTIQQLMTSQIEVQVNLVINNLRNYYQALVNKIAVAEERQEHASESARRYRERQDEIHRLQKAGVDFIKNNTVDYGGKTVAQIATELGISKSEVRRRKANGEL